MNDYLLDVNTFVIRNFDMKPPFTSSDSNRERNLYINQNSFSIKEINSGIGLKTTVKYFMIPNDDYGALVRRVKVKNISGRQMDLELLNGMPRIIP